VSRLFPLHPGQVIGPEGVGQQIGQPARAIRMIDEQLWATVLQKQLTAPSARHQCRTGGVDDRYRKQPSTTAGNQCADHRALGTET
jgi:hypothetical protein